MPPKKLRVLGNSGLCGSCENAAPQAKAGLQFKHLRPDCSRALPKNRRSHTESKSFRATFTLRLNPRPRKKIKKFPQHHTSFQYSAPPEKSSTGYWTENL